MKPTILFTFCNNIVINKKQHRALLLRLNKKLSIRSNIIKHLSKNIIFRKMIHNNSIPTSLAPYQISRTLKQNTNLLAASNISGYSFSFREHFPLCFITLFFKVNNKFFHIHCYFYPYIIFPYSLLWYHNFVANATKLW